MNRMRQLMLVASLVHASLAISEPVPNASAPALGLDARQSEHLRTIGSGLLFAFAKQDAKLQQEAAEVRGRLKTVDAALADLEQELKADVMAIGPKSSLRRLTANRQGRSMSIEVLDVSPELYPVDLANPDKTPLPRSRQTMNQQSSTKLQQTADSQVLEADANPQLQSKRTAARSRVAAIRDLSPTPSVTIHHAAVDEKLSSIADRLDTLSTEPAAMLNEVRGLRQAIRTSSATTYKQSTPSLILAPAPPPVPQRNN